MVKWSIVKEQLTFENVDSIDKMDKSDALDRGGPGRVGDSGSSNKSDTEPSDKFETLFCGDTGRGDRGGNPSGESVTSKPERRTH